MRAIAWAEMARGTRRLGTVYERGGAGGATRYWIDFGRRAPKLYSYRGVRFDSREMAEGLLRGIEVEVAKGRQLSDVLSEFRSDDSSDNAVGPLLHEWLRLFEKKVKAGDRAPRTLKDYARWVGPAPADHPNPPDHFCWWRGRSVFEITTASLEEWSYWMAERGLSGKTRRNVFAGFHAFMKWLAGQRPSWEMPLEIPWPEAAEHLPTILSRDVQTRVLEAVPEAKRGIYYALADLLLRPSEARVLRVRDWTGDEIRVERASKDHRVRGEVRGPKKRKGVKTLPASDRLMEWLEKHVPAKRRVADPDGPLFHNPDGYAEGWWSAPVLSTTWYRACDRAGVPRVGPYEGTKHSTATYLKGLGADDRLLAAIMGHSDPRSVEKYAKVQGKAIRSALAKLERTGGTGGTLEER